MKLKLIALIALGCLIALPAAAESPYIFGWHFWRDGANIDSGGGGPAGAGKPGWVTELAYSTNFQPDVNKFKRIADEGHTIIMRVDWAAGDTYPPNSSDYWIMAARYAFWVDKLKDYCHIWLIGNEEWTNVNCFREVRKAVHAVQPEAIFCPGSPFDAGGALADLGDYCDGMSAHTTSTNWIGDMDTAYPSGKTKPCYITEFCASPPNQHNQFRIDYGNFNYWNATHGHKLECATKFVYYEFGSEYSALQMQPMQNADYCEAALQNYTNSYAQPYIGISDISETGLDETTSQVSWTTDVGATGQVEYWEKGEIGQHWSTFNGDENITSHTASTTGLIPGHTYEYVIKSCRAHRPLTLSSVQTFVHEPPTSGTITGYVKTHAGEPVPNAAVTRNPGSYSFTTDDSGKFTIGGCPQGTYDLTVSSNTSDTAFRTGVEVTAGEVTQVDVAVTPKVNYLQNPGFESGMAAWTGFGDVPQIVTPQTVPYPWFGSIVAHRGEDWLGKATNWGQPKGGAFQRVTGLPAGTYQFTVFSQPYLMDHPYNETKERVGIDPTGGTDAASANVQWSSWRYNFWLAKSEWKQLVSPAAAVSGGACTVFIQYDDTCMQGWHVHSYDDATLMSSVLQAQIVESPAAAKSYEDGVLVQMSGVIATTDKGTVATDVIYVENTDRTSGIKVDMAGVASAVLVGDTVSVTGTMATDSDGERYIGASQVTTGPGTALRPLGLVNKNIGGADLDYDPGPPQSGQRGVTGGIGINNVGLLVRTTGQVVSSGSGYVMISDGSSDALKVDTSALTSAPSGYVSVTGIASIEPSGSDTLPVLRPRGDADVQSVP